MTADRFVLRPTEFELFQPALQRNPEYNPPRLALRRKLDAFGKRLVKRFAGPDLALTSRASLHHPYRFNAYKVDSQFVYLSRGDAERRALKRILGVELGKDLDQNYVHAILCLEIHQHGLELALRVHQQAWWDGENLKRQVARPAGAERLTALLTACPGFALRVHDWRRAHPCEEMTDLELRDTLKRYTPGEHWLHVEQSWPREDDRVHSPDLEDHLAAHFEALLPLYRQVRWTEANDRLFR